MTFHDRHPGSGCREDFRRANDNPYAPIGAVTDEFLVPRVPQYCLGNSLLLAASFPYLVFVSIAGCFGAAFVRANAGSLALLFLLGSTGMGLAVFARTRWHWFSPVFLWSAGSCLVCWMLLLYLPDYPLGGMAVRAVWIMLVASLCVPFSFHRQTRFAQQIE